MTRLLFVLAAFIGVGLLVANWPASPPPTTTTTSSTSSTTVATTTTSSSTTTSSAPSAPVTDPASAERALRERGVDPDALSREIAERMRRRFQPPE
jgi:hypothetical protein